MDKLTPQEQEALQAVYQIGEGNIKAFLEAAGSDVPYTTFASTIKNLEKKGFLKSRLVGNAYLYAPVWSQEEYKKKFMTGVVKDYFKNSYKEMVSFFVQQKKLSPSELKEIIDMIEKGKDKAG